ncbi:MAG: Hsp20/alpha crystallin family protein, partial [Bacteroidales bacterium]|nr:Hsp20/alpha crystallin family protein [Bacteroidales bacterium]
SNRVFNNDLNDVFENFWNQWDETFGSGNQPDANILESEKSFIIELSVPGYQKNEISVKVDNNVLSVSYEHKEEKADKKAQNELRYVRQEFAKSEFVRNFRLSRWVNAEEINANFKDGILTIEVPKREELISKPIKEIEIK